MFTRARSICTLLKLAKTKRVKKFCPRDLDDRDTKRDSGIDFIKRQQKKMTTLKCGEIATIMGRFYAMDRDNRWERIEAAYRAVALGEANVFASDPIGAIKASYAKEVYDEEFEPTIVAVQGAPKTTVSAGDAVIFFNFRPDRARELTEAFVLPSFAKFDRPRIRDLFFATMAEYEKEIPVTVAFPPVVVHKCLAEVISSAGLKQSHIAETEKYAHVTFS